MTTTPTKDSIERALGHAKKVGQIKDWTRGPGYGPHPKWLIEWGPGADGPAEIRTYTEAKLVCAALSSAWHSVQAQVAACIPARTVDVSDVDGPLAGFWIDEGGEDDYAEVICKECRMRSKRRRLGTVTEAGDAGLDTLVRACLDHVHEDPDETAWTEEERHNHG